MLAVALIWGFVFVEASTGRVSGENPMLMDTWLLAENGHADSLLDKVGDVGSAAICCSRFPCRSP